MDLSTLKISIQKKILVIYNNLGFFFFVVYIGNKGLIFKFY